MLGGGPLGVPPTHPKVTEKFVWYLTRLMLIFVEENQKGKTTEVAEGESKIKELTSQVEELNASAACLG